MNIAVDFDGTIVEDQYPAIGEEIPFALDTLKMLIADRHKVILWSCREGQLLEDAVEWCRERGVEFYAVNRDYPEEKKEWNNHFSRNTMQPFKPLPIRDVPSEGPLRFWLLAGLHALLCDTSLNAVSHLLLFVEFWGIVIDPLK